jgi:tetratricopeptide (TPR) repeat protein
MRLPQARANTEKALAIRRKALAADHPDLARCYLTLGTIEHREGLFAAAEGHYSAALAITEKAYGPDSAELSTLLTNIADLRLIRGRATEAEALCRRSLANVEKDLGPKDPRVAHYVFLLGGVQLAAGRVAEAKANFSRALSTLEAEAGPSSFRAAEVLWGLSRCARLEGKRDEALKHLGQAEALCDKSGENDKTLWGTVMAERAWHLYHEDNDLKGAENMFKRALELIGSELSPGSLEYREPALEYIALLKALGRTDEARALETRLKTRDKSIS